MTSLTPLFPRQAVPALEVATIDGGTWCLVDQAPAHFTLIAFYRGLHCPICSNYLGDLHRRLDDFAATGVGVIAVSSDNEDRARQAKADWKLDQLSIGYGLSLDQARAWGLYISSGQGKTSIGVEEPALFSEPGLFLVRPDGTLYFGAVQTMPFARPRFADIHQAVKFVIDMDYPARGEVMDHRVGTAGGS